MEFKREDFEIVRSFEDKIFLGLRADFFDEEPLEKEEGEEIEAEPTAEELAEIARLKEIEDKKAELKAELAALEEIIEEGE